MINKIELEFSKSNNNYYLKNNERNISIEIKNLKISGDQIYSAIYDNMDEFVKVEVVDKANLESKDKIIFKQVKDLFVNINASIIKQLDIEDDSVESHKDEV